MFVSEISQVDKDHWRDLAKRSSVPDPFSCGPAWQLSYWYQRLTSGPLFIRQTSNEVLVFKIVDGPQQALRLEAPENNWFFGCNILGRHAAELLRESLIEIEREFAPRFPWICISGTWPSGRLAKDLTRYFKSDFDFDWSRNRVQCAASLRGGWDGYLGRRSPNTRRNIRKQLRRADEAGVAFERHCPGHLEADLLFDRMLAVELQSWKGIQKAIDLFIPQH